MRGKIELRLKVIIAFVILLNDVSSYKPVVLLHGILSAHEEMEVLADFITSAHPGTEVHNIAMYEDSWSVDTSLWAQLNGIVEKIKPVLTDPNGVHLATQSKLSVSGSAIVQKLTRWTAMPGHDRDSGWPQYSELCVTICSHDGTIWTHSLVTDYIRTVFPNYTEDHLYLIMYIKETQDYFSVSNYWHDPFHLNEYNEYCTFLTSMNNAIQPASKENFLRLKNMILVGGKDDGVITPWESSQFSFFGDDTLTVVPMKEQKAYINDTFGLRTLDERGGIKIYSVDGVEHTHWRQNQSVFDCCIEPWLD